MVGTGDGGDEGEAMFEKVAVLLEGFVGKRDGAFVFGSGGIGIDNVSEIKIIHQGRFTVGFEVDVEISKLINASNRVISDKVAYGVWGFFADGAPIMPVNWTK